MRDIKKQVCQLVHLCLKLNYTEYTPAFLASTGILDQ